MKYRGAYRTRIKLVREKAPDLPTDPIRGPADVYRAMRDLQHEPQEVFRVIHLNTRALVVGVQDATRGILDASLIDARSVFGPAYLSNAASIIVVHNHPSGDPTPSAEDRAVTRHLVEAGKLLGIPVLDHVVIGHGRFESIQIAN